MAIDRRAFSLLSYGLYVITASAGERGNGQIANVLFQVTSRPPRLATALNKDNFTHDLVKESGFFAATVLSRETTLPFVGLFGFRSGRDVDKLAKVGWRVGEAGLPIVTDFGLAAFECRVFAALDAGTHTLFVADVVSAAALTAGEPLTYDYYHNVLKGKTAANAPTYEGFGRPGAAPAPVQGESAMKKYVCTVCGYVYDPAAGDPDNGVAAGTPFEKLPASWVCPICGASQDQFEPQ